MRQGPHQKRGRGRGSRRPNTPNRNQTFDSNGPDVRIRGNAHQVYEKYLNLARDASASGDRVLAESYFQHADHYYRIVSAFAESEAERRDRNAGNGGQPDVQARDWSGEDEDRQDGASRQPEREPRSQRDDEGSEEAASDEARNAGNGRGGNRRGRPRRQRDEGRPDGSEGLEPAGDGGASVAGPAETGGAEPEAADGGDAEGIRRTLKMTPSAEPEAEAGEVAAEKPRRRRRAPAAEAAPEAPVADEDGAAAAS